MMSSVLIVIIDHGELAQLRASTFPPSLSNIKETSTQPITLASDNTLANLQFHLLLKAICLIYDRVEPQLSTVTPQRVPISDLLKPMLVSAHVSETNLVYFIYMAQVSRYLSPCRNPFISTPTQFYLLSPRSSRIKRHFLRKTRKHATVPSTGRSIYL